MSQLCKCGVPHDGWLANDGGKLCQMCWEAELSESWWEMVKILDSTTRQSEASAVDTPHGNPK